MGFEPTNSYLLNDFESFAFDHSATSPSVYKYAQNKEKINWQKELIESGKFNNKFSKNLLENGAKNFMQGIYLGYMYSRWRKIRGLDKDDPIENKGQMQSSFKDFEKKIK